MSTSVARIFSQLAGSFQVTVLGDLALLGMPLCGHVVACRSGHPLNLELVKTLEGMIAQTKQCVAREMAA